MLIFMGISFILLCPGLVTSVCICICDGVISGNMSIDNINIFVKGCFDAVMKTLFHVLSVVQPVVRQHKP